MKSGLGADIYKIEQYHSLFLDKMKLITVFMLFPSVFAFTFLGNVKQLPFVFSRF